MSLKKFDIEEIKQKIKPVYRKINKNLFGALDVVRYAGVNFSKERAPEAAASMAYFTFFSLFPLVLVLISFSSIILKSQFVQDQILDFIVNMIPVSPDLITSNIQNVLSKRGTVGSLAIIGLMWSASSMFNILALNIDRAWPEDKSHNIIERRLIGFAILIGLTITIILFWFFQALLSIDLIKHLLEFFKIPFFSTNLWDLFTFVGPRIFRLTMFWIMYQWIPKASVKPVEAFWGALFALILTDLITLIMSWYLGSQWMRYELVYGSLGRIIALLLWIYLTSFVVLFGAHISSAVAQVTRRSRKNSQEPVLPRS